MAQSRTLVGIAAVVVLAVGLGIGILFGHYVTAPAAAGEEVPLTGESTAPKSYQDAVKEPDSGIAQRIINGIDPDKIRENLM